MATPTLLKRSSSSFVPVRPRIRTASMPSTSSSYQTQTVDITRVTLPHAHKRLCARYHKSLEFAGQFLEIVKVLQTPSWSNLDIVPQSLTIHKVSGSLTNDVFFVSSPVTRPRTLLLRVYGPSSGSLISRPHELHILHALSSRYSFGPKLYGTFENGRVEEYFDAVPLTPSDLRDKLISRWIGTRMAELHSVDVDVVVPAHLGTVNTREIAVKKNVRSWLTPARDVLSLPSLSDSIRKAFDLDSFEREWNLYMRWLSKIEDAIGASERVFSHNDTQYGNLLRLNNPPAGTLPHRQIIVVDFEYASFNPAAFDVANHFHEWTANYHSATPHLLDPSRFPDAEERRNFYRAYLEYANRSTPLRESTIEKRMQQLDKLVRVWSPASHGMWAVWGLVQAREALEGDQGECEFDYVGYALSRMEGFRREIRLHGIQ